MDNKRGMTEQEWNDMHEILKLSFVVDPAKRITAEEILNQYPYYRTRFSLPDPKKALVEDTHKYSKFYEPCE